MPFQTASPRVESPIPRRPLARLWLGAILLVSAALRVVIALGGGQFYWPDETRYGQCRDIVITASGGQWRSALDQLLGTSDHILFRMIGLVPATFERLIWGTEPPAAAFAAVFFASFSVASLGLIWLTVRRATRNELAASWSAFLYAGCVTAFFFTRHYFPYDVALFFLLLAIFLGQGPDTARRAWAVGATVGAGYLTYNAYWNVGGVILAFYTLRRPFPVSKTIKRGALAAAGLITPVLLVFTSARLLGHDLIAHAVTFSRTVTQGDFGRGAQFIWNYFSEAEGAYALLLVVVALLAVAWCVRRREGVAGGIWLLMAAVLAGELVFFSDVVPRFAVAGRMAKPVLLFLSVGAGIAAAKLFDGRGRVLGALVAALAVLLAARNFERPLTQIFPADFRVHAKNLGVEYQTTHPEASLGLLNAHFFHGPDFLPPLPAFDELLGAPHPLQFRPYVYEGYAKSARDAFAAHDIRMRLVRFGAGEAWALTSPAVDRALTPHLGVVHLSIRLPAHPTIGAVEPLVVTGIPERGDLFSIRYLAPGRIQVEHDHWGVGLNASEPIDVSGDPARVHEVVLSIGSLLPTDNHPYARENPALSVLSRKLIVEWNGRIVLNRPASFHPANRGTVTVGRNFLGGSTAGSTFTGEIIGSSRLDPRMVARREWGVEAPSRSPYTKYPGPTRITFDLAATAAQSPEAFFVSAQVVRTLRLLAEPAEGGRVFSLWINKEEAARSEVIALAPGRHEAVILSPSCFPPAKPVGSGTEPVVNQFLQRAFSLSIDGVPVLSFDLARTLALEENELTNPLNQLVTAYGSDWPLAEAAGRPLSGRIESIESIPLESRSTLEWTMPGRVVGRPADPGAVGPIRLTVRFAQGAAGAEPLVTTGRSGAGDVLFVAYDGPGRLRFGHDHWGWKAHLSEPVAFDPTRDHVIEVRMPSLLVAREGKRSRHLRVLLDGQEVFAVDREFYDSDLDQVVVGWNLIGASSTGPRFTGKLLELEYLRE